MYCASLLTWRCHVYAEVQQMLETYVQSNLTQIALAFENQHFDAELYDEYVDCQVLFGEDATREIGMGCARVPGMVVLTVHVRPGVGPARAMEVVDQINALFAKQIISPTPPLSSSKVQTKVPIVTKDLRARTDWAMAQVSCPFHFDTEI